MTGGGPRAGKHESVVRRSAPFDRRAPRGAFTAEPQARESTGPPTESLAGSDASHSRRDKIH